MINFKKWLDFHGEPFWEGSLDQLPAVNLTEKEPDEDEFDRENAESECENEYYEDDDDDNYDSPEDDPEFESSLVDDWESDNPEPDSDNFEDEDDYQIAYKDWKKEKAAIEEEYEINKSRWYDENDERQNQKEYRKADQISDCVGGKHQEWKEKIGHGGYEHKFTFNNTNFEVEVERVYDAKYEGQKIPDVYSITFNRQGHYTTNNEFGSQAIKIYSYLIATIKAVIEKEKSVGKQVNGFVFTPAEPAMGLIYQRFYKKYLQPNGFIRVDHETYMNKEFIKSFMERQPAYKKSGYYKSIINNNRELLDKQKQIKSLKFEMNKANTYLGKLIKYKDNSQETHLGVALDITKNDIRDGNGNLIGHQPKLLIYSIILSDGEYFPYENIIDINTVIGVDPPIQTIQKELPILLKLMKRRFGNSPIYLKILEKYNINLAEPTPATMPNSPIPQQVQISDPKKQLTPQLAG